MKKKFFCVLIALCVLVLSSCTVAYDDSVTGDVKQKENPQLLDELDATENAETDIEPPEVAEDEVAVEDDITESEDVEKMLSALDSVLSVGGEYNEAAEMLCEAVVNKDKEAFAEFTGGRAEYYEFLERVEIASYKLIPFEILPEVLESHIYHGNYPVASDNYLVEFDVASSDCEEFTVGKCIYYAGFEMNPLSGNVLSVFVPWEKAERNILDRSVVPFTEIFAKEFASLYPILSPLYEGRNYADTFDFSNHPHLITHLMAKSGDCGEPPYTRDEINKFITGRFDGNAGLSAVDFANGLWINSHNYGQSYDAERIYGCSYAHGGTSAVLDISATGTDGSRKIITLDVYADFSKVAKAYTLVFYFDGAQDEYTCLTMVELRESTGREAAILSV